MSIQFDDPMNKEAKEFIKEIFKDIPAMDEKQALINDLQIKQKEMKELANIAKQPVALEINGPDDIKTMSDGTKYHVTDRGWVKIDG